METRTILTNKAKRAVLTNKRLRLALYNRWEVFSFKTLQRWCIADDPRLSHTDTINLICAYEKCEPDQLTEVIELQPAEV